MKVDRACSLDWLIILTTGRAGSTTILNMLNAIPQIAITGELNADHPRFPGHSGHVLRLLFDVLDASTSATVVGLPGDPSYAAPQVPHTLQVPVSVWFMQVAETQLITAPKLRYAPRGPPL